MRKSRRQFDFGLWCRACVSPRLARAGVKGELMPSQAVRTSLTREFVSSYLPDKPNMGETRYIFKQVMVPCNNKCRLICPGSRIGMQHTPESK